MRDPTHTLRASGDGCVSWCDLCTGGSPQLRLWYRLQAISEAAKPISKESMGILRVRLANVTEMIKNEEDCQ